MRLLFATPYYYPDFRFGGPPRKIHALARGLAERGHQLRVITFDFENRRSRERRDIEGVEVEYLPWIGRGLKQVPLNLRSIWDAAANVDAVQCYGLYNLLSPIVAYIACRRDRPFVLEPLGMYPPRARNPFAKKAYNFLLTSWMMRRATAVIAASQGETAELGRIVDPKKIVYRRNGIDISAFANLPSGDTLRQMWGISPNEKVILYVGRISPIKNLEQLILAFAEVDLPNLRLVLVGPILEPAYDARLRALIATQHLEPRVLMAGPFYGEEQRAALALADLFVLPSLNESFGNAAAEAVAAGVPVLLTDTCGIAPLINGRAGLSVPLGVKSLASGLRTMINDPARRKQLVARRAEVVRELSWDEPVRQTEDLYQSVIEPRKLSRKVGAENFR
jgi:glycosyltransferase involved in cell wall biosynthesis